MLRLEPKTGRTHQLRVQCALRGMPIIGDKTYGDFNFNRKIARASKVDRLCLHAGEIEFSIKINNKKHKLYFFEYRINKTYLNEISNLNLISLRKNNNKSLLFFDDNYDSLQNEINNELEGGKYDYLSFEQKELTKKKFDQLNSKILNHKHEEIDSFFDIDYIANVLAMKTISGSDDGFEKCNLIAPLSLTNNKFYPIIHRDCEFREIKNSDKIDSKTKTIQVKIEAEKGFNPHSDLGWVIYSCLLPFCSKAPHSFSHSYCHRNAGNGITLLAKTVRVTKKHHD